MPVTSPQPAVRRIRRCAALAPALLLTAALLVPTPANAADTTLAADAFDRTVASGLGTAPTGGAWATASTGFSVSGGAARAQLSAGGRQVATLASAGAVDTQLRADFGISSPPSPGMGTFNGITLRAVGRAAYTAVVRVRPDGTLRASINRTTAAGVTTTVAPEVLAPGTVAGGARYAVRAEATGTSPVALRMKVWAAGTTEPAAWTLSRTDSAAERLTAAGGVGVNLYNEPTSGARTVSFDNVRATTPGAPLATPITEPAPVPAPATGGTRGAPAIGTADYGVPAGALVVSPTGNDGAAGTVAAPLRTAQAAVNRATAGQTLVLRGGTYHERVVIPRGKRLTVQPYPREAVWFDGSVPTSSWKQSGTRWISTGWTATFDSPAHKTSGTDFARYTDPASPMATYPDMMFVNGTPLRQVGSASAVVAGTFHVDYGTDTLTIGSNPSGAAVRASNLSQAFEIASDGTVLRGIGIRRYANALASNGVVYLAGTGAAMRDTEVSDNATTGVSAIKPNIVLDRNSFVRNGMVGLGGYQADGLTLTANAVNDNNTENFKPAPTAAGAKIVRTRGFTARNNDFLRNRSAGLWLDESVTNFTLTHNTAAANTTTGLQAEISETGIIADNRDVDNKTGIQILSTGNVKVFNNLIGGNTFMGLKVAQDDRRQAVASWAGHDTRRPIPDPTCTWVVRNIAVSNNVFTTTGLFQIYAISDQTGVPGDRLFSAIDGNLFGARKEGVQPTVVALGELETLLRRYQSAADLTALRSGWVNAFAPWGLTTAETAARASSLASGVALPADVASAVGQPAGTRRVGTF